MRQVILYPGEDGYWVIECPSLPGCISQGKTKDEAIANIREAIELYIETLVQNGQPVPEERFDALITSVPITAEPAEWRQVILYTDEDSVWCVICPSLPGCFSEGKTKEEAIQNVREAIALWIESVQAHGETIPAESFEAQTVVIEETPTPVK